MLLYATLAVCAFLAGLLVYRYDLYEREPLSMLAIAAAAGFGMMALLGPIEAFTLDLLGPSRVTVVSISAVAATHEELGRLLIVVALAVLVPSQFNDPMDGIIYGSIVGLGMAVEESIFYLRLWHAPADAMLPPAELLRLFGHLVMGGITGFGVGMARMRIRRWPRVLVACVLGSMLIHFLWDCIALVVQREGKMIAWQTTGASRSC